MSPKQAFTKMRDAVYFNTKDKWSKRIHKRFKKKGSIRIQEYEDIIILDSSCMCGYSKEILKGKLPEKLHNKMIAFYLMNDIHAKFYFEFIKTIK